MRALGSEKRKPALLPALALALAGLSLAGPSPLVAQAVCSASHSSPTLTQNGSIRTLPRGAGWLQVSLYRQRADQFYNHLGSRQPFLADSEFRTRSAFVTGAVGLMHGLELWAQAPYHHLRVDAASGSSTSTGFGDLRLAARMGAELFGLHLPVAVRAGVKVPGSEFPVDATVLPLSEGQTDFEMSVESGRTLGALPLYVVGWAGYRWRSENEKAARRPGNERFVHLALGGMVRDLRWELAADGLWGLAPGAQGLILEGERRRLIQVIPTVGYRMGGGSVELTGQIPVSGRSLPNGVGLSLGYRLAWGL